MGSEGTLGFKEGAIFSGIPNDFVVGLEGLVLVDKDGGLVKGLEERIERPADERVEEVF